MKENTCSEKKHITLVLMDPPFESSTTTSAFRLIEALLTKKHAVNVFAYEGATALSASNQKPHIHSTVFFMEDRPHELPKNRIKDLFLLAKKNETRLVWTNCGICMDERGIDNTLEETASGTPADLVAFAEKSDITLIIPAKRNS